MRLTYTFLVIGFLTAAFTGCKDPKEETTPFDKEALLRNFADRIIVPSIERFQSDINALQTSFTAFETDRTAANLEEVRTKWKTAYLQWQAVKIFDFGPIRNRAFKASTGTYPTDTVKITSNITAGGYDLASINNIDAIGLPALDFLLYRNDAITYFAGDDPYTTYTKNVIQKMVTETQQIVSAWSSYRATFIASTGTETTSAFSGLVNEFNRDYELAKNAKLGIPIGKQSLGIQLSEYIEARYSGISLELLDNNIRYLDNLYKGNSFNSGLNGVGFDDYLKHLERSSLDGTIRGNFASIRSSIGAFNGTLEEEMNTNTTGLDALYTQMHGQVVSLKTDMTSAFGVLITYQDNDGD